jgi:hypothetical protein
MDVDRSVEYAVQEVIQKEASDGDSWAETKCDEI